MRLGGDARRQADKRRKLDKVDEATSTMMSVNFGQSARQKMSVSSPPPEAGSGVRQRWGWEVAGGRVGNNSGSGDVVMKWRSLDTTQPWNSWNNGLTELRSFVL